MKKHPVKLTLGYEPGEIAHIKATASIENIDPSALLLKALKFYLEANYSEELRNALDIVKKTSNKNTGLEKTIE